jgi:hypothetical protein
MVNYHRPKGSSGFYAGGVKARNFHRWYFRKVKNPIPYSKGKGLFAEILNELGMMSITTGEYFLIPNLGFFCACKVPRKVTNKEGKLNMDRVGIDWNSTKKHWKEIYPDKTAEEIKKIEDKPYIYHRNKLTTGNALKFNWIKPPSAKGSIFHPMSCLEAALGNKAKEGCIGTVTREDFKILIRTIKKRKP